MNAIALQTVRRRSVFTRLDFRPKLFLMAVVTVVAFIWEDPRLGGGLALAVLISCLAAGIQAGYIRTVLTLMLPFSLLVVLTQGFFAEALITTLTGRRPDDFRMLISLSPPLGP